MSRKQKRVLWWVSFAHPSKAAGDRFLGVSIIDGTRFADLDQKGEFDAVMDEAWRLKANPGGAVQAGRLPEDSVSIVPESFIGRLLSNDEVDEMNAKFSQHPLALKSLNPCLC